MLRPRFHVSSAMSYANRMRKTATRYPAVMYPLLPSGPRTIASAKIAPSWTTTSSSVAAKREPIPARTSSSSMPSGVAMVTRSSRDATRRT